MDIKHGASLIFSILPYFGSMINYKYVTTSILNEINIDNNKTN